MHTIVRGACLGLLLAVWGSARAQQIADPDFDAAVAKPSYVGGGPTVAIDEAHANFHTAGGNYKPFAELLRNDGYNVVRLEQKLDAHALDGVDVLVVANANAGNFTDPAFTEEECDAVADWVRAGGSLLLIADHAPYGASTANLAARFGIGMGRGWVFDVTSGRVSTQLTFSAADGSLGSHPVLRGREAGEEVRVVRSFTGQSLGVPLDATVLLALSPTAREAATTDDLDAEAAALSASAAAGPAESRSVSVAGRAQGLALRFGQGRVMAFGEAAMFSAQVATLQGQNGPVTIKAGMNVPGTDNRQLALNVVHWLSGLLEAE